LVKNRVSILCTLNQTQERLRHAMGNLVGMLAQGLVPDGTGQRIGHQSCGTQAFEKPRPLGA